MIRTKKTTLLLLKILETVTTHKDLHFKFLNTLSYLEYIGARKMLKSLPAPILNKTFLEHINEEIRHSLFLKNLAQNLAEKSLGFKEQELIVGSTASHYFQEVDHYGLKFSFSNPVLNYLYTTYAIEQRAALFYSLYNDILKKKNFPFSMQTILNDEVEHLDHVLKKIQKLDPFWETNMEEISQFEHQKYFSFLISLEKKVSEFYLTPHFHPFKKENNPSYHKI
ncbi:MAG: hypothetical protein OXJ52_10090 [Oligoflexia bacterium]|nr:hypothetical protein [Oligoflexia bacterium]